MEITTKNVLVTTITPEAGKYLTQANLADNEERIFSTEIWLGGHDSPDNWMQVDEEYKTAYEAELKGQLKETKEV